MFSTGNKVKFILILHSLSIYHEGLLMFKKNSCTYKTRTFLTGSLVVGLIKRKQTVRLVLFSDIFKTIPILLRTCDNRIYFLDFRMEQKDIFQKNDLVW